MKKILFLVAIFVIACVVNTASAQQVEVVNQDLLDTQLVEIVDTDTPNPIDIAEADYFWFKTDGCWYKFSWDGASLSVLYVYVSEKDGAAPVLAEGFFQYTLDSGGKINLTEITPAIYVQTFSARTGWKNKEAYSDYWVLGGVEYKKKSTHYSDMAMGEVATEEDTFLYDYDLLIEKNKISLKILSFSISNPEQKRIIYEREFIAD
ncbi:MAG: hypothetical protein IKW58_00960 [Alphaproteobacteria bacterium]|nr:hypothetical protein [Alphaproteobacteria bacterium]